MFYDRFYELCSQKGVKPGRACTEMGVSRGLAAKWKATGAGKPSAEVLEKMSVYFGMSINEILGTPETEKAPTQEGEREITDRDVQVAFFRGADLPDDQMDALWQDARDYINYKISQMKKDEK